MKEYIDGKPSRNIRIDIIRGIGIIMVVWGHIGLAGTHFIYLFHMALFFIASGFVNRQSDDIDTLHYIISKVKSLYIPYVFLNGVGVLLNNVLVLVGFYTNDARVLKINHLTELKSNQTFSQMGQNFIKVLFFRGGCEIGSATWFLRTLFEITIIFFAVQFFLKRYSFKRKLLIEMVVILLLLCFGFSIVYIFQTSMFGIERAFICFPLYMFGYYIKNSKLIDRLNISGQIFALICLLIVLIFINIKYEIEIGNNKYGNPIIFILASLSGWFLFYFISSWISYVPVVKNVLAYIGRNSLYILLFHFISFKFVNVCIASIMDESKYVWAAFPTAYGKSNMAIFYLIAGVGVPLLLHESYNFLSSKVIYIMKQGGIKGV